MRRAGHASGPLDVAAIASALAVVLALLRGPATRRRAPAGPGRRDPVAGAARARRARSRRRARAPARTARAARRARRPRRLGGAPSRVARPRARSRAHVRDRRVPRGQHRPRGVRRRVRRHALRGRPGPGGVPVPLDFTASQGTSLTRPLDAASLARWSSVAPGALALPVLRLPAAVVLRNGSFVSPDLIGLPASRARRPPRDRAGRARPVARRRSRPGSPRRAACACAGCGCPRAAARSQCLRR